MSLALRSNRVVLRERGKFVMVPARVRVAGARIAEVQRDPPAEHEPGELDLGERLITPAFINSHTHLALSFLRGAAPPAGGAATGSARHNLVEEIYFGHERRLQPADVRAFTRMGAYESLLAGVGFVWDHYYGGRAVADALLDTGLAGVTAPTLQDLAGPGVRAMEAQLEATLGVAGDAQCAERGVLAALGPHATDTVSPALFRRIGELARSAQLPVHLHVAQSYDELLRVEKREGRSPLALLSREGVLSGPRVVMAHALFAHEADLRTLDPARHALVYCPSSQLQFGFPAPVPLWSDLGVRWLVGSDCGASNDGMGVQHELRAAAGAASAMTSGSLSLLRFFERGHVHEAEDAWAQRKERVARFLPHVSSEALLARVWHEAGGMHPALTVGSIEAGALANLAIWDLAHPAFWPATDPLRALAFGDTSQALYALYVAGRAIGTPGDFARSVLASEGYREARREADQRLAQLQDQSATRNPR